MLYIALTKVFMDEFLNLTDNLLMRRDLERRRPFPLVIGRNHEEKTSRLLTNPDSNAEYEGFFFNIRVLFHLQDGRVSNQSYDG